MPPDYDSFLPFEKSRIAEVTRKVIHPMVRSVVVVLALGAFSFLGCSLDSTPPSQAVVSGSALQGKVHGGQQAVVGAHVYLLAAGSSGYGSASASLLNGTTTGLSDSVGAYVLTDGAGFFSITGDYKCTAGTQVYLFVSGGNPGAGTNSVASFMTVLGSCPQAQVFPASTTLWVNEVTTAATAYALAGFAIDSTHIGAPSNALAQTNLANAFAMVPNLVNTSTGAATSSNVAGTATAPQTHLNSIANILAACVNTNGSSSTGCMTLLGTALANGATGTMPGDVATAAINMAHYPQNAARTLYNLASAQAAFAPSLSAAPADITLQLTFTSSSLTGLQDVEIDASGNAWISNYYKLLGISSSGSYISPASGYSTGQSAISALAIDNYGTLWGGGGSNAAGALSAISQAGVIQSGAPYTIGTAGNFYPLTIDASNNIWSVNYGLSQLNKVSSSGTVLATYTGGGMAYPEQAAIDGSGNIWVGNYNGTSVSKFLPSGTPAAASGYATGMANPNRVVVDATNAVWVGSLTAATVVKLNADGSNAATVTLPVAGSSYIAMDGANTVWTVSSISNYLHHISSSGTLLTGAGFSPYANAGAGRGLSVDGCGDVWLAFGSGITEWIGLATPVVTPITAAVKAGKIAAEP